MPLSPRTKMRRYRERMTEIKKEQTKEKNRLQQTKCRQKWTEARKKDEQRRNTVIQQRLRKIKKAKEVQKLPSPSTSAFSTRQAAGKAMRKVVAALPSTPRRRSAVLHKLAADHSIVVHKPKAKRQLFSQDTLDAVERFYLSDEISRQLPGRKDYVTIKKDGEKQRLQKKILLMNVMEAYQQFKIENSDIQIGKSKFASLRPPQVCICSDKDQNVCCCVYHENFSLLLEGLQKVNKEIPDADELIQSSICTVQSIKCYLRECTDCPEITTVVEKEIIQKLKDQTEYTLAQWSKTSVKENVSMNKEETKTAIVNQLSFMVRHSFIAKHQLKQIKNLKKTLNNEIILQEDFSENFSIKQQNEIMSAHWKSNANGNVTLFTAIIYLSEEQFHSYVVVSDSLDHDKYAVVAFNRRIFEEAQKRKVLIKNVHVFTDGAGSQFKNCFTLSLLTHPAIFNKEIEFMDWSFFATAHGKGPIDGIGGTVKRSVWRRILQNRVLINSAEEFSKVAQEACPNINVLFVSKEDVLKVKKELDTLWAESTPKTITDTRKLHFFRSTEASMLEVSDVSFFQSDGAGPAKHLIPIFKGSKKPTQDDQMASTSFSQNQIVNDNAIAVEKYFAVDYVNRFYIGRVISEQNGDFYEMKFLHQQSKDGILHFLWPERPDVDLVHKSNIFYGPVLLKGCLDYTVDNIEQILYTFRARHK